MGYFRGNIRQLVSTFETEGSPSSTNLTSDLSTSGWSLSKALPADMVSVKDKVTMLIEMVITVDMDSSQALDHSSGRCIYQRSHVFSAEEEEDRVQRVRCTNYLPLSLLKLVRMLRHDRSDSTTNKLATYVVNRGVLSA